MELCWELSEVLPASCAGHLLFHVFTLNYPEMMGSLKEEIYLQILALLTLQMRVYPNTSVYPGREKGRFL